MSGCHYETRCPNCGEDVNEYSDHKPFGIICIGPCLECGFQTITTVEYLSLEALNESRDERNSDNDYKEGDEGYLAPLKKLPKQEEF